MARKKPCKFCEGDQIDTFTSRNGHQFTIEFYPDNCLLAVSSFANDENGESVELTHDILCNYCPACGRKLGY